GGLGRLAAREAGRGDREQAPGDEPRRLRARSDRERRTRPLERLGRAAGVEQGARERRGRVAALPLVGGAGRHADRLAEPVERGQGLAEEPQKVRLAFERVDLTARLARLRERGARAAEG